MSSASSVKWKAANPERARESARKTRVKLTSTPEGRIRHLLYGAKTRAAERGLPFSVTVEDLFPLPEVCPILGLRLNYGYGKEKYHPIPESPSIDRKDPKLGYVAGNVRVISWRANRLRSDATAEELVLVAQDAQRLLEE